MNELIEMLSGRSHFSSERLDFFSFEGALI